MASGYGVFRHPQSECRTIAVCLRDQSTRGENFLARSFGSGSQSREGIVTLRVFYFSAHPTRGGLFKPFAFFVSRTFTIESHTLPWKRLEFSFPCHGKDRAFKSRRERLGRVWRNWQTRLAQAQLSRKRLYRFKSDHPHCRLSSIGRAVAS